MRDLGELEAQLGGRQAAGEFVVKQLDLLS
jgi:hypothetical protein